KVIDTGATAGLISVTAQVYGVPDDVRIYLGDFKTNPSGAILVYDSTTNGNFQNPTNKNRATITVNYTNTSSTATAVPLPGGGGGGPFGGGGAGTGWNLGPVNTSSAPLTNTRVSIVVNQGGSLQGITKWDYKAQITPIGNVSGGITKLG